MLSRQPAPLLCQCRATQRSEIFVKPSESVISMKNRNLISATRRKDKSRKTKAKPLPSTRRLQPLRRIDFPFRKKIFSATTVRIRNITNEAKVRLSIKTSDYDHIKYQRRFRKSTNR